MQQRTTFVLPPAIKPVWMVDAGSIIRNIGMYMFVLWGRPEKEGNVPHFLYLKKNFFSCIVHLFCKILQIQITIELICLLLLHILYQSFYFLICINSYSILHKIFTSGFMINTSTLYGHNQIYLDKKNPQRNIFFPVKCWGLANFCNLTVFVIFNYWTQYI